MKIVAKAPCRVDLAGGTLDIWPLYLFHPGAVTLNFAVEIYASCTVRQRKDQRVSLRSADLGLPPSKLPLPALLLKFFNPGSGLDMVTDSQAPAGAGLAGSSTLMVAVAGALRRLTGFRCGKEKLREIVQNVEAQVIRVPTGCQDYYPALYGGVNAVELGPDGVSRKALAVDPDQLSRRMVLAYTGAPRQSGINNWEVMKAHIDGDRRVHRNFDQIAAIARAMCVSLEKAGWAETGRLMREEWQHRKRNAPGITTPLIDHLIKAARNAGATGAKACGAGGGGCVAFLVEEGSKPRVEAAIEKHGGKTLRVRVAERGLRVEAMPE